MAVPKHRPVLQLPRHTAGRKHHVPMKWSLRSLPDTVLGQLRAALCQGRVFLSDSMQLPLPSLPSFAEPPHGLLSPQLPSLVRAGFIHQTRVLFPGERNL